MPINNLTNSDKKHPVHTANPASIPDRYDAPSQNGKHPSYYTVNPSCNQHHGEGLSQYFPTLNLASGTELIINHMDIASLKVAANSLSENWKMPNGNKNVYTTPASFTAVTGGISYLTEWNQICNIFNALASEFSSSATTNIDRDTTISISFYNELVSKFNFYATQCLCNSDCSCNSNCTCNGDCGCNYSDRRLKTNIKYLYTTKLDGKFVEVFEYEYTEEAREDLSLDSKKMIGVMAQDLLELGLDEYVVRTSSGIYGVRYDQIDHIFN